MADLKLIGTVAIMVACFAVIYPRFMHPLFMRALGMSEPPNREKEKNSHPPGFNNPQHPHPNKKAADDIRRHMRGGPHPGMRAAAEMQKQQAQQGSGRGMMGVVLPMYAIGIVLYLLYTLFKVFNKSKKNEDGSSGYYRDQRGPYQKRAVQRDRMGFPMDYQGNDDVQSFLNDQQRRQDLEDLLTKVDDKNVSTEEMRILQRRLEETEAQMSRILAAMQSVQSNVDQMNFQANDQMDAPFEGHFMNDDNAPQWEDGSQEELSGETDDTSEVAGTEAGDTNTRSEEKQVDSSAKDTKQELGTDEANQKQMDEVDVDEDGDDVEDNDQSENEEEDEEEKGTEELIGDKHDESNDEEETGVRHRKVVTEKEQ